MKPKQKQKSLGFTLIELLVVISIIGLLTTVIFTAVSDARLKARDARRKADLRAIRTALTIYYNQYNRYPDEKPQTACGGSDAWASSNGTCGGQWLTTDANFYQILAQVPRDPRNTGTNAGWASTNYVYSYFPALSGRDYELITQLENPNDPDRCANRAAYYHNLEPNLPWCAPWPNNVNRNAQIYSDH